MSKRRHYNGFALAPGALLDQYAVMANTLAYIIGIISLVLAIPAVIPLLGWMNWIILLFAAVGVLVGMASDRNGGRNFCLVVMGICALRLWAGGGLI